LLVSRLPGVHSVLNWWLRTGPGIHHGSKNGLNLFIFWVCVLHDTFLLSNA
jgi:hypothetical protein